MWGMRGPIHQTGLTGVVPTSVFKRAGLSAFIVIHVWPGRPCAARQAACGRPSPTLLCIALHVGVSGRPRQAGRQMLLGCRCLLPLPHLLRAALASARPCALG